MRSIDGFFAIIWVNKLRRSIFCSFKNGYLLSIFVTILHRPKIRDSFVIKRGPFHNFVMLMSKGHGLRWK